MRLTQVIAAAVAPPAVGSVLRTSAGQASAVVAAPAVLTANVHQPTTVSANGHSATLPAWPAHLSPAACQLPSATAR